MKINSILSTLLFAAVLAFGSPAFAAKGAPKIPGTGKGNKNKGDDPAEKFDKNHNGRIDPDEVGDLQAAFEKDKNGALKKYDTNHNGNLEKSEIASIHVAVHNKK